MTQLQTCPDCGQPFCPDCGEHYPGNVGAAPQAQKQNLQVAQRKPALGPQWDTRTFPDSLFTYLDAYVSTLGPHAAGPNAGQKIRTRWASPTACVREYLSSHAASGWNANTVIPDGRIQMFWEWVGDQIGFLTWNSVVPGKNYSYIEGFFFGLVNSKVAKLAPGAKTKSDVQASLRTFLFGPVFAIGTCVPGLNPYAFPPSSAQWPAIPPSTNTAFWICIAQKIAVPLDVYEGATSMQDAMSASVYEGATSMQQAMGGASNPSLSVVNNDPANRGSRSGTSRNITPSTLKF